ALYVFTIRRPSGPTLFPYTTLFRSLGGSHLRRPCSVFVRADHSNPSARTPEENQRKFTPTISHRCSRLIFILSLATSPCACCARSEEHTSELQSRSDIVCRLLLEKK